MKSRPRLARATALRAALLFASLAGASPAAADPPCAPEADDISVAVAAVSDDLDVTLADGRILRLAGIDPGHATAASRDLLARARQALAAWSADASEAPLTFRPLLPIEDRWGRIPALLLRSGAPAPTAAEALVAAGLARVRPETAIHACIPALLAAETEARAARRGLWADPHYAVLTPSATDGLAAQAGQMALVEGILHVHEGRGGLYLALGRDRRGFVAVVARRDAARFVKAGLDLHDYEGTPVRLRGDLDARFGPRMRLADPDAVESLEPGSLPEEPDGKDWTARAPPR